VAEDRAVTDIILPADGSTVSISSGVTESAGGERLVSDSLGLYDAGYRWSTSFGYYVPQADGTLIISVSGGGYALFSCPPNPTFEELTLIGGFQAATTVSVTAHQVYYIFGAANHEDAMLFMEISGPTSIAVDDIGWTDIPGGGGFSGTESSTLTFTMTEALDGYKFRCLWTSARGSVGSTYATVSLPVDDTGGSDPWPTGDDPITWPVDDVQLPDAVAPASNGGSSTLLDLIRQFSSATRTPYRLVSANPPTIKRVDINTPSPFGYTEGLDLFTSVLTVSSAGQKTLALLSGELSQTGDQNGLDDDMRIVKSNWAGPPCQLPVAGEARPAPVIRRTWTFTPQGFKHEYSYAYPTPLQSVRRSS
jgi:hypothetical protein